MNLSMYFPHLSSYLGEIRGTVHFQIIPMSNHEFRDIGAVKTTNYFEGK